MRVLADRIAEAGHPEAAAVLSDLADQWEVGVWEGEQDESGRAASGRRRDNCSARRVNSGALILLSGGESMATKVNPLDSYYLLVAGKTESDERFTQIQVKVTNGQVDEAIEVETTSLDPSNWPKTIDEYYDLMFNLQARVSSFNLVHAFWGLSLSPGARGGQDGGQPGRDGEM